MFKVFLCVGTEHNLWLVAIAAFVCAAATVATFFLYSKTPVSPLWRRASWLTMTGLVAGSGIWTTHFVAMLAFKTGLPTGYAPIPTLASLLVAVVSTTTGFAVASAERGAARPTATAIAGGAMVGLGITLMHYVGMDGYRTEGVIHWDGAYVAASVVIGAVFAALSLYIGRPGVNWRAIIGAAGVLTVAIVGMHFTGMTAVTIVPDVRIEPPENMLSNGALAALAIAVTAVILATALGGVAFDAVSRNSTFRRLRDTLEVMPEGLAFFTAGDRISAWNSQCEAIWAGRGVTLRAGMRFRDLLQIGLDNGAFVEAVGREHEWLEARLAMRRRGDATILQHTADNRWFRVQERRLPDGGVIVVTAEVTELKLAEAAAAEARDRAKELARRAEAAEAIAGLGHWRVEVATGELTWSRELYRIYGFPQGEPLDLDAIMAMNHPDDRDVALARLMRNMVDGEPDRGSITRIVRANGDVRYLASNADVERDAAGEITAVLGTAADVTEQKTAELAVARSEERFRRLAVNAPDMIAESKLDGTMTYVSPVSLAVTGFTPEELVGRSFTSLMEPEDAQKVLEMCQQVFAAKGKLAPWPVEFRARHKDGSDIWLECKPTLYTDPVTGRFAGLTDIVRDITPRKAMEAQLRQAQAEAEAAAAVKGEFLANMSHELRTPLTSIIGFTGLAAEQGDLTELTRGYVERVGEASRALLATVNDILDFSKLEAGQVPIVPQPVSVARLTRATLDLFAPQAGAKDLALSVDDQTGDDDLVVALDPDRIRQVLLNFVSNAVKFTAEGGVTLRTTYRAQKLRVEVIDTGAGIPKDKQDRLFQRFSQIDGSLTRAQGGTGLGLAICKGLIEAMGGRIGVTSRAGKGSTFWFEVPAPRAKLIEADTTGGPARPTFDGVRVLVADDHPANRELARLFLAGIGAEVAEAEDGAAAVEAAQELPYDVILMDVRMPKLSGIEALRAIRAEPGPNDATPILAFTADAGEHVAAELTAGGFDGVVAKPLEPAALFAALAAALAFEHPTLGGKEDRDVA